MGLRNFRVVFGHPQAIYEPGQTVSGKVIVELDTAKKFRGIKIRFVGSAETHWTSQVSHYNSTTKKTEYRTEHYTGHETFFDTQLYVLGSASGEQVLQRGHHIYPFAFQLPSNLPSSFEADVGHIRYTVKVTIDRPWKFDHETKAAFSVISSLDLNQHESAKVPIHREFSKKFGCFCCTSAPLTISVSLPVSGYVPGQAVPVAVDIENHSGKILDNIDLQLQKRVTYHASCRYKKDTKNTTHIIAEASNGPIGGSETLRYDQKFVIPSVPPSSLNKCRIISVEYVLVVTARVANCCAFNLSEKFPLIIGTIPVTNYQMPLASQSNQQWAIGSTTGLPSHYPTAPSEEPRTSFEPSAPSYGDLPPPSYEEAMYTTSKGLRDHGESEHVIGATDTFVPRYPVYNFST